MGKNVKYYFIVGLVIFLGCSNPEDKVDKSKVPGKVIDHIPARTEKFVGSPSLAILPNGNYVASHDIFGPGSNKNTTLVFLSYDKGQSWEQISKIRGQFWSGLFVYRNDLYIMGTDSIYGHAVIRKSQDGGKTWTNPQSPETGLLTSQKGYHTAPVPVKVHNGRIWRAMEDNHHPGGWGAHFRALVFSAPARADLLDAGNWTMSNALHRDSTWLDGTFKGWLEGNIVINPDGKVLNMLRVDHPPAGGIAARIMVSEKGKTISFKPEYGFIDFPGGSVKFTIRFDSVSNKYWSLTNIVREQYQKRNAGSTRNTLALISSPDLENWTVKDTVLQHQDVEKHGFQYPDWQFAGNDIIFVSRTAYDDGLGGAANYHDANFLTFHRIQNFRGKLVSE